MNELDYGVAMALAGSITEVLKRKAKLPGEAAACVSVLVAVAYAFVMAPGGDPWRETLRGGILAGLAMSGLYSGAKAVKESTAKPV